ncbi:hypothetical protein SAMN05518672_114148 [Chitinophaga sp. CF118]|uniref:hypothetical protein n=1 Tax=Chitinophaga sp. CF118 TaxID=1884367 RepID=UPI0008EA5705|nr:hypothetical protein [Chitinophaga sp. CF118]SFF03665.1 hypothetical protein SAMN05518672_114148 [Chitinophaga sp. CF118]
MKKLTLLLLVMIMLGTAVLTQSTAHDPLRPSNNPTGLSSIKKNARNFLDCSVTLTRGSNLSGSWVIEFMGSSGSYQYSFYNRTITVPSGTYTVGIHQAGSSSGNYSFSGSVCTLNYSASGSSALFNNVPCTCGAGSFSVN